MPVWWCRTRIDATTQRNAQAQDPSLNRTRVLIEGWFVAFSRPVSDEISTRVEHAHCALLSPSEQGAGRETLTKDRAQHEMRVLRRQLERPFKFYFDKWHFNCNCAHSMWSPFLSPLSPALCCTLCCSDATVSGHNSNWNCAIHLGQIKQIVKRQAAREKTWLEPPPANASRSAPAPVRDGPGKQSLPPPPPSFGTYTCLLLTAYLQSCCTERNYSDLWVFHSAYSCFNWEVDLSLSDFSRPTKQLNLQED